MNSVSAVKPSQLRTLLAHAIPAKMPVLICSGPGIGKSSIVEQACAEAEADCIIMHPVVSDPTDFKGMPWVGDGRATFLPFGDLEQLIHAAKLTACFIDDLGQATPAVQAAAMQLILARTINGHRVSDQVVFIAATNRRTDRAGASRAASRPWSSSLQTSMIGACGQFRPALHPRSLLFCVFGPSSCAPSTRLRT